MSTPLIHIKLPHGGVTAIAQWVKMSKYTVSAILLGKKRSPRAAEIMQAAEYLSEYKAKEAAARAALEAAIKQ